MKELKEEFVHVDEYEIDVKKYLGYDEIQKIIETTLVRDNFADREKNIDMLLLHYAAGIPIEQLEKADPDVYLKSGLVDCVKGINENWYKINRGIEHYTSTTRLLGALITEIQKLPESPEFKDIIRDGVSN